MPEIQPIRGLRYDLGHVGSLSDVIAPPYDVISPEFQDELYKKHPANVIRLILNRQEPGDDDENNRYSRAARFLKNWQTEGVLQKKPILPCMFITKSLKLKATNMFAMVSWAESKSFPLAKAMSTLMKRHTQRPK